MAGRVQGVGFRWFVRQEASRLGLVGWVANLPDGRVESEVEGPADVVDQLASALASGPALARVERIDRSELTPGRGENSFTVRA